MIQCVRCMMFSLQKIMITLLKILHKIRYNLIKGKKKNGLQKGILKNKQNYRFTYMRMWEYV